MRKIRKYLFAGMLDWNRQKPNVLKQTPTLGISSISSLTPISKPLSFSPKTSISGVTEDLWLKQPSKTSTKSNIINSVAANGISTATDYLSGQLSDEIFGDSELGRAMGNVFSSGISSAGNTIADNIVKGLALNYGLGLSIRGSIGGTLGGLTANYLGKGITSAMGNSKLGKFTGGAVSSAGGQILGGMLGGGGINIGNPYAFGMLVLGSAFGAMNGPSKEYGGKYGGITKTADTAYNAIETAVNFIPGYGQFIAGGMELNKGLSNLFGSTDGMTKQDAWLGSAFMPAPIKWMNMWGAKTTDTFNKQSWLNTLKTNAFMGNAFGNLGEKFSKATEEAGKTYGTTSRGAYNKALKNIEFANNAWEKILAMADLNELLKIRSLYMTSINNQRYALNILGGWSPLQRGKYGMKILNNATNHNIGMRLLSGAALIDNKQMILCNVPD